MIAYLVNMVICSGYFILIYLLLLERVKMHWFNRFYLLFTLVLSLVLPLLSFQIQKPGTPLPEVIYSISGDVGETISQQPVLHSTGDYTPQLMLVIYLLISTILFIRFGRNLYVLNRGIIKADTISLDGARLVLTTGPAFTHSFLHYIFVPKNKFEAGGLEKEIITHELAHVKQKHSVDIILLEILKIFFWFNPFIYLYKRSIQLNHEFLADASVIASHRDTSTYQQLLLAKAMEPAGSFISSSFNYLVTKKRLIMMTRSSSKTIALTRQLALIPLFAIAVFLFCIELNAQTPAKPGTVDFGMRSPEWGAGTDEVKEFEVLVNKYKSSGREWWKGFEHLTSTDRKKMETIFFQMSKQQRRQQMVAFRRPIPPSKSRIPEKAQLEKWKDPKMYGVWIDGRRVKNSVLNNYINTDFSLFYNSRLSKNAINYGKHYYQVDLMTNSYYQDYYSKAIADTVNVIMFRGYTFQDRSR